MGSRFGVWSVIVLQRHSISGVMGIALSALVLGVVATGSESAETLPNTASCATKTVSFATKTAPSATVGDPFAPVQVADEITRRLRRMGINIIPTRIDRPYDPEGELC